MESLTKSLEALAEEVEAEALQHARQELATAVSGERIALARRPNIVLLGRINAGKSTLLNGFVGESVVPTGAISCTETPIRITHSLNEAVTVEYFGSEDQQIRRQDLSRYASRRGNRSNVHNVRCVQVRIPLPSQITSASLLDTPGFQAADEDRLHLISECLDEADIVLFVYACPSALPGRSELEFLRMAAARRCRLVIVQNEFDDPDDPNPDEYAEVLESTSKTLRATGIPSAEMLRVGAADSRGIGLVLDALGRLLTSDKRADLLQACVGAIAELERSLAVEREALEDDRNDAALAIAAAKHKLSLLKQAHTEARSFLGLCSAQYARLFREHCDSLRHRLGAIAIDEQSMALETQARVNRTLAEWMHQTSGLEAQLQDELHATLKAFFEPTGLVPPRVIDRSDRTAPLWRYAPPESLGSVRRWLLGNTPKTWSELMAAVLTDDARRLLLFLERELAAIVPQCTSAIETWLASNVEALIARIENGLAQLRDQQTHAEVYRRRLAAEGRRQSDRLRSIQRQLREFSDGK